MGDNKIIDVRKVALGEILIKKLGLEERINFCQFWTTCIKGLAKCNSSNVPNNIS